MSDSGGDGIRLPPVGTGARRDRRAERRRHRVRFVVALVAAVVLAGSIGGSIWALGRVLDDDEDAAGGGEVAGGDGVTPGEAAPKMLVVHVGADGALSSVTSLMLRADEEGGSVVFVPVGALMDIPGFGLDPLLSAFDRGGSDLVGLTVENLMGVTFDRVLEIDSGSWTTFVDPFGSLTVDSHSAVEVVEPDGAVTVLYPEGEIVLPADEVGPYLESIGDQELETERLVRHDSLWRSYLEAFASVDHASGDPTRDREAFLDQLAAGPVRRDILPVSVTEGVLSVNRGELDALLVEIAPETAGSASNRIRVQVLNGTGTPRLAERVTELLVPLGARVDLQENAREFDHEVTKFLYYYEEDRELAARLRDGIGVGEVVMDNNTTDVVDVTVVVGADFLEAHPPGTQG